MPTPKAEDVLELWRETDLTQAEIAEELDTTGVTINIILRSQRAEGTRAVHDDSNGAWRDEETLRELYHGEGLTQAEVADELDCATRTVRIWMDKHDIERRSPGVQA